MHQSIRLFADTIEAKIEEIIDNTRFLQQHGHEVMAGNVIEQAQIVLEALEVLRQEVTDARAT